MQYENVAVVKKDQDDYKVLCFVSGKSKAEVIRNVKKGNNRVNIRNNGKVWIDHPDFPNAINSNLL